MKRLLSLVFAVLILLAPGSGGWDVCVQAASDLYPAGESGAEIKKYVSAKGSDRYNGDSPKKPYATVSKAITAGASIIYIDSGIYHESVYDSSGCDLTIVGYGAVFAYDASNPPKRGNAYWDLRNGRVYVCGVEIRIEGEAKKYSGFLLRCGKGELTDCKVTGAPYMGLQLDGAEVTRKRCTAVGCGVDGFSAHDVSGESGEYASKGTFIDCVSSGNGDDGLSYHENGSIVVVGGEYYDNVQAGIAPNMNYSCEIDRAFIHDNGTGIEAINKAKGTLERMPYNDPYPTLRCTDCVIRSNRSEQTWRGYGISVMFYNVTLAGCRITDNGRGRICNPTDCAIKTYKTKRS